jgi:hypothetical protein
MTFACRVGQFPALSGAKNRQLATFGATSGIFVLITEVS